MTVIQDVPHGPRSLTTLLRPLRKLWSRTSLWSRLLVIAIGLYGVVFSVLTALRVYALQALGYDLGIYNQAMHTTVFNHGLFFYTASLPSNPSGSLFGVHFSPILFLLLIPYALVPFPFTLTVLQTWAIAMAAAPLYALCRRAVGSEQIAFAMSLAYLLHPATHGVNWYDFHPESFLPLALLSGLYFLEKKKWKEFALCMGFALSTIEMASFLVATVAGSSLLSSFWSVRKERRQPDWIELRMLVFILGLAAIWFLIGRAVELSLNPRNVYFAGGTGYWSVLGATGVLDIPVRVVTNPLQALAALGDDAPLKLWYVLALFGPVLFLPLRSLRALLFCTPWLVASLLSNNPPFYRLGDQYPAFILPFIFYGATIGIAKPWRIAGRFRSLRPFFARAPPLARRVLPLSMLTTTVAFLVVVSPLGPVAFATYPVGGFPLIGYHEQAVESLYRLIPGFASVLTQNNLFPLVSNRPNSFLVPVYTLHPSGTSFNGSMDALMASVDYILVDYQTRANEAAVVYDWTSRSGGFSVIGAGDGAILLERGSSGLALFTPFVRHLDDSNVFGNGSRLTDSSAQDGVALRHVREDGSNFWYGPYAQLSPGVYEASYRLRVDDPGAGTILELPVILWPLRLVGTVVNFANVGSRTKFGLELLRERIVLLNLKLTSNQVPLDGEYFWVTQSFVATDLGLYEFPGLSGVGSMGLWFDGFRIEQRAAFGSSRVPTSWVNL